MSSSLSPRAVWASILSLSLTVVLPAVGLGQESTLAPEQRVRLTLPCGVAGEGTPLGDGLCHREGVVVRHTAAALELRLPGGLDTQALESVAQVEARRVEGPGWKVPTFTGLVVGGVGTYALLHSGGSTSKCDRSRNQDAISERECVALTVAGAAVGAGLGRLVASLLQTERWVPVPLGRVMLTIVP